jgi:UDP-glucose 4-epimerase
MRTLVTGGAGFIGSRLVERLAARGDEVTVVDIAPLDASYDGFTQIEASTLDRTVMHRCIRDVDTVVHLAGYVREGMLEDPFGGASLQVQGTLNVLEACRENGIPHVAYASSFYVYDGIEEDQEVDESTPLDPHRMELFGSAKLMGEALCREYQRRYGLTYTVFRIGATYGPGDSSVVGSFLETGKQGLPIEVWGAGRRRNQYVFVEDLADGIAAGMTHANETFNLISPEHTSIRDIATILREEFGFETKFDESRPEGPSFPYMSARRARDELGWDPTDLRSGIRATMDELEGAAEAVGHNKTPSAR